MPGTQQHTNTAKAVRICMILNKIQRNTNLDIFSSSRGVGDLWTVASTGVRLT
jgi:hypothetical protein